MTGRLFHVRLWSWLESCQLTRPQVQRPYGAKHVRWTNFAASLSTDLQARSNLYREKQMTGLEQSSIVDTRMASSAEEDARDVTRSKWFARWSILVPPNLALILLVAHCATTFCSAENLPARTELGACRYSAELYDGDASLMKLREAPTRFTLMTSRYVSMVQAVRGYQCAGTTAVGFDGRNYLQTGRSDDPGMMELIPTVARLIGMSLANTYDLIVFTVISSGILIGYSGFWQLYPKWRLREIGAVVFFCLAIAEARIADEYMFQVSPLIAGIPWMIYFGLIRKNLALTISAALLVFCCSWCSLVRSGSIVICMTFLFTMFAARYRVQKPWLPFLLTILACVPSVLFERSMIARRDIALAKVGATATAVNSHPLWHTIYIGLGFIPNSEVPEYRDGVGDEKVRSIDPTATYTSARYQAILRRELWRIAERRPMLILRVVATKAAIIILVAAILLLPAWRLIFAERAVFWLDFAFILTIGMSAMNGIVAVPRTSYLLTFLCLTFLYSSIKLCRGNRSAIA
jgi:hypothetical protein